MAKEKKKKVAAMITPPGSAYFCNFRKEDEDYGGHGGTLLIDKDETDDLTAFVDDGQTEISFDEWKELIDDMHEKADGEPENNPIKDGDNQLDKKGRPKKKPYEAWEGKWAISLKTKHPPKIVDTLKQTVPENIDVWGGDIFRAVIRPWAYDGGVSLRLDVVQLIEKNGSNTEESVAALGEVDGYVSKKAEDKARKDVDDDDDDEIPF